MSGELAPLRRAPATGFLFVRGTLVLRAQVGTGAAGKVEVETGVAENASPEIAEQEPDHCRRVGSQIDGSHRPIMSDLC